MAPVQGCLACVLRVGDNNTFAAPLHATRPLWRTGAKSKPAAPTEIESKVFNYSESEVWCSVRTYTLQRNTPRAAIPNLQACAVTVRVLPLADHTHAVDRRVLNLDAKRP